MTWQDQLAELESQRTAGDITKDAYRRRRDEILASASSAPGWKPRPPDPEATQKVRAKEPVPAPPPATWTPADAPAAIGRTSFTPMQGAEVFGGGGKSRSVPKRAIALVAVALLAVAAGVTWWFAFRQDEPAPVAAPPTMGVAALVNPTDVPLTTSGTLSLGQAADSKLIDAAEVDPLTAAGVTKVHVRSVTSGSLNYRLFGLETTDSDSARKVAAHVADHNRALGLVAADVPALDQRITTLKAIGPTAILYDAVYAGERGAVRVVVLQAAPLDETAVAAALKHAVDGVASTLPVR